MCLRRGLKSSADVGAIQPIITHFRFCEIIQSKTDLVDVTYEDEVACTFPKSEENGIVVNYIQKRLEHFVKRLEESFYLSSSGN